MRILAVGNMYPPHHAGGYELAWQAAVRYAREHGHEVRVVASEHREPGARREEDPDVHRTLRWYWDLNRYRFAHRGPGERLRVERHNLRELRRHLVEFRPEVVSWWSMGCMSLSLIESVRRAGIPAVFVAHDDWLVYGFHHDAWIHTWRGWRRLLAPVAELVFGVPARVDVAAAGPFVFNSRYTLERARRAGFQLEGAKVIYPGIDPRFLSPLPPRRWSWRLLYVGRIDRQKGVDVAVSALAHLPAQTTLAIWGAGDERYAQEMRSAARSIGAGERVRFEGFADPETLRSAYASADAVIFPVRWQEPFGLVPLEAMGMGRPVLTTPSGGTREFVRDGENALVFPRDRPDQLAACVKRLAGDESLRTRLRDGGRRTARDFTLERFARLTVQEILRAGELCRGAP